MSDYDPTDFAHGLEVLEQRAKERELLFVGHIERGEWEKADAVRARYNADIDDLIELLISELDPVVGRSSAGTELISYLGRGKDGYYLDLAHINALHAEFAMQWGANKAFDLKRRMEQPRKAAKKKRKRKTSHGMTPQELRDFMHQHGFRFGQRGYRVRLLDALNNAGHHLTESQLYRLLIQARTLQPSR